MSRRIRILILKGLVEGTMGLKVKSIEYQEEYARYVVNTEYRILKFSDIWMEMIIR